MEHDVSIRLARRDEQTMLESLQRRASLNNPGDRDALLAHPDAIALPIEQITSGCVFVAERDGVVVGFVARGASPRWRCGVGRALRRTAPLEAGYRPATGRACHRDGPDESGRICPRDWQSPGGRLLFVLWLLLDRDNRHPIWGRPRDAPAAVGARWSLASWPPLAPGSRHR